MVFVTVGNATQGFLRLLDAVDRLAGEGLFRGDEVLVQAGHNAAFQPRHARGVDFLALDRFQESLRAARLVISHCGAGTLMHVLKEGKVPVVMPRRKIYREHVDDHQLELVEALAANGRVIAAFEPHELPAAVAEAECRARQQAAPPPSRLIDLVAQALRDLGPARHHDR